MTCCEAPTFSVYYSVNDPNTSINTVVEAVGNTLLGTINAPLYRDPYLQTAFPGERAGVSQTIYVSDVGAALAGQLNLFLHDGTITVQPAGSAVSLAVNKYVLPAGTYTFSITSGTGAFLNAKGVVVVTVAASGLRSFDVFLETCGPAKGCGSAQGCGCGSAQGCGKVHGGGGFKGAFNHEHHQRCQKFLTGPVGTW